MGKQINQSIVIDAKIKATLEGMNDVVSKLNKGLREGTTKIDLTKGVGNSISKQIETFKTEYSKFIQLTKDGKIEFGDAKDAIRSGEQMVKTFSELKRIVGNFEDMSLLDAKKMFPDAFDSRVDLLSKKLNTLRENIVSLDSKKIELNDARQALSDLTVKQQALQKELSEQLEVKIDTEIAEQNLEEAKKKIGELREELKKELSGKLAGTESIKNSLEARKAEILKARKTRGVTSEPLSGAQVKAAGGSKEQQAAASQALKLYNSEKAELKEIEEALRKNAAAAKEYRKALTSADSAKLTDLADKAESSESKINEITDALKKQEQAQIDLNEASERREQQEKKTSSIKKDLDETTRSLELQEQKVNKLQTAYDQLIAKTNPEELIKAFKELGIDFTPEMAKNEQAIRQLQEQLNALDEQDHQKLIQSLQKMGLSADSAEDYVRQLKGQLTTIDDSAKDISRAAQEMENLKNQIFQFFSVTNAIQLFKRIVQSAINTVKKLDAVMTETAVVTDFSIGDMWKKLPEYASHANALGASIKDVYAATTLYYQQGLQTNEAMGVGVETMKMARIANLEAGDATQYMTAALRGFNMEVNELNAERVNDVYSELAAITAADTSQIATAMSKTASIASAANMEFETTAALLAQIIETTQEAPETAGTALKTIIARFSEVKKLREEGQMTGEDEEGEVIDVNKIQGALRTVGISMDDFFAGTEGLDSVLLKLAEKWKDLDFTTQRYIATTAAGSRQQSRFIAMMSDYERTMELATAANNSAGASQQQFDKTLESMEAKLQKLKNAWDQFAMGLANNEILKFGADTLTFLLKTINKVIEAVSGGNGLTKSFLTLQIAIAALSGARALLNKLDQSSGLKNFIKTLKDLPNVAATSGKQAGENIRDNLKPGFEGAISDARQAGVQIGQQLEQGIQEGRQLNPASLNVKPSVINDPNAQSYTIEEVKEETNKKSQVTPISEETINKTNAFKEAMKNTSAVAHRTTGILFTLAGAGATYGASAIKAKDETDALAAGLESAGAAASIGGSALSMLAPILSAGIAIGPVIGIIAGLTAVIGLLSWAVKDAYNKSLEGRLEAAAKSTENARIAAEEAKAAYDELLQNKAGYNELQSTLNELTRGTNEWKQALVEANQQVLQLLETYPELVQFMSREGGQLVLEDAGWNYLENLLVNQAQNTQRLYSASQMSELALGKELQNENLLNSVKDSLNVDSALKDQAIYSGNEVLSKPVERIFEEYQKTPEIFAKQAEISFGQFVENFKQADAEGQAQLIEQWNNSQFASKYGKINGATYSEEASAAAGPGYFYGTKTNGDYTQINFDKEFDENINIYSDGLFALAEETGLTTHELYSMREGLATYDSYLQIYGQKLQVYAENLLSYLDEPYQNSQYSQQVTSGIAKNFASRSATEIEEKKNSLLAEDENGNKANIQNLAKQLNESGNYKIVDTTGSDKTYQEIYEQLTGASAEGLSIDVLANEISKIMVSEELSDSAQELISRLDKLATKEEGAANQAAALISQDVSGLNLGEISSLEEVDLQEIATQLEYDNIGQLAEAQEYKDKKITELDEVDQLAAAQTYMSQFTDEQLEDMGVTNVQSMLDYMKQNEVVVTAGLQLQIDTKQFQDDLETQKEDITKGIDSIFEEDGYTEKNLSGISTQNLKNLTSQIAGMGEENGKEYVAQFQEIITKSNLGEEQADQLATYLSNVDWSDMNEAVAAMDYMRDMGLDPSQIKNFWNVAVGGANTYISSLEEALALTEALQEKMKNVGEIEKALTEGTGTYDQMMELVNAGVDISNFQLTPEGWKATAEQIEFATDKLKQYNAEQARMIADQQAKAYENALNNTEDSITRNEDGSFNVGTYGLGTGGLTTVDSSGKLVAGTVDMSNAEKVAAAINVAGYNSEVETYDQFIARIQEAYNSYINLLNNGENLQIIANKQAAMAEAANYTAAENEARGGTEESIIYSAQNEATEAGLDANEMMEYAAQLQNVHTQLDNVTAAQVALANSKMNMGLGEIISSYKEWVGLIDKSTGLIKASSSEDVAAFNKLKESVNKMLSTSEDLSDAFWKNEKNMKNLKKAAEGDTEALEELQKAAASDYLNNLDLQLDPEGLASAEEAIQDFTNYLSDVDIPQLEAGVQWNDSGAQEFINRFNDMAQASNLSAEQIQNAVKSMGFDAEINYVTQTRKLPIYEQTETITNNEDGSRTLRSGTPKIVGYENVTGEFPVVKTLTSSGSGGGGVSTGNINAGKSNKPSGGGGGSGGSGSKKKWENPYDEFYNVVEDINEALRQREKLERRYQALLDKTGTKASDLVKNIQEQIKSLEEERKMHEGLLEGRKRQMSDVEKKYKDLEKYARYNEETGTIEIDWEKINELDGSTREKLTSRIEEYIAALEEQQELIEEEEDSLADIENMLYEIRQQGKDEYFDLEAQIKEAIAESQQAEIDKLSAINDSINDTNSRLIDAMQSSIDKYRQDRENDRAEEELADKQRRLAYMQQDTSGANALDIMQLQEEIDQAQEDYTDTLIDQKISELQQQNDEAAEQRQRQIDIMQAQLDKYIESGEVWNEVYGLMEKGINEDGIVIGSDLYNLLASNADYVSMSNLEKIKWAEDLIDQVALAVQWLSVGNSTEALLDKGELASGQQITFTTASGDTITGTLQDNGDVIDSQGNVYTEVYRGADGEYVTEEKTKTPEPSEDIEEAEEEESEEKIYPYGKASEISGNVQYGNKGKRVKAVQWALKKLGYNIGRSGIDGVFGYDTKKAVMKFQKDNKIKQDGIVGKNTKKKFKLKQYLSGGLADFTGPAWLDGTKSKPEYILNADQTKAFFELVDVLSGLNGIGQSSQITGDSIYDVDINVESIGSDYDVEQLAQTVKRMINDDARYRNNNTINLSR